MSHVGFIIPNAGNGFRVECIECVEKHHVKDGSALFEVNVYPYGQSCHSCKKQLVEPQSEHWCELFEVNENDCPTMPRISLQD